MYVKGGLEGLVKTSHRRMCLSQWDEKQGKGKVKMYKNMEAWESMRFFKELVIAFIG